MKKLLFSMLVGMMTLGAMAQGGKFTVKGTFEGRNDSVALVLIDASTGKTVAEEIYPVTGEPIEMSCDLTGAARLFVVKMKNGYQSHMVFPAIPGERLELVKDEKNITQLQGSQFYVDYNKAEKSIEEPHMAMSNFVGECQYRIQQGESEEQVMKDYEEKAPVLAQALADAVKGYVKAHPDQDAAAALIAMLDDDTDEIEAAAALLTERARGSVAAGLYKSILAEAQKEAEEEARQEGMTGNPAPDFTLNDINGKPLALSSLRGKWVIIDFWGSWCKWCIKGIPDMKEYYTKYAASSRSWAWTATTPSRSGKQPSSSMSCRGCTSIGTRTTRMATTRWNCTVCAASPPRSSLTPRATWPRSSWARILPSTTTWTR